MQARVYSGTRNGFVLLPHTTAQLVEPRRCIDPAVRIGDWPTTYALGEYLSVDVAIAA